MALRANWFTNEGSIGMPVNEILAQSVHEDTLRPCFVGSGLVGTKIAEYVKASLGH